MLKNIIIDAVFPRRCPICHDIVGDRGQMACHECERMLTRVKEPYCIKCGKQMVYADYLYCEACEKTPLPFEEGRAVFLYDDIMRKSIYMFKYNYRKEYAKYYAAQIAKAYSDKINKWNVEIIVPIPLHKSKLKKRGFNQAELIAKELSNLTKIPVNSNLLIRVKKTEKQKDLCASGRGLNIKNAFKIRPNRVQYLSAMLIDDIYTTGATMISAAKVLKDSGIKNVYCMSLSIGKDIRKDQIDDL